MSIKYDKKEIQTFASISDVLYRNIRDPNTLSTTPSKQKKDVSLRISDLSESSLFILSKENIFRKFLIKIVLSKWFDTFIVATIILNTIILGIYDYNNNNPSTWRNDINTYTEPVFTSIFTLECLIKIIAYGFIFGKNTYLKDKWNWIDFLVVLTSLMSIFPQFDNYSAFRTFRLLRPLRSLNSMQKMKLLVTTLLSSLSQLGEIMLFSMFFFLIFAIMGVSFWAGNIHYRCRITQYPVNGDWVANQYDTQLCGDRSCPYSSDLSINTYCGSLVEAHDVFHNVTVSDVYRDTKIPDLNFGLVTFDNVMISILTIYQCITTEGWTMIMYYYSGSFSPVLTHIVFISMIIVCSFFLLNLTIAVLLDNYCENENLDGGLVEAITQLNHDGKEANLPQEVIDFIIEQDITSIKRKRKNMLNQSGVKSLTTSGSALSLNTYQNLWVTFINSEIIVPQTKYYKFKITRWMYYLAMHPLFNSFILLMIVFNTILLAFDRYPEPPQSQQDLFADFNIAFIAIFGLEVVIKLVALGIKDFVRDKFNMFDALVVVISLVEVSLSGSSSLSALRSFRLFRIFKIFRVGDLRILFESVILTIYGMGYYAILVFLFMYIFTLLGMQLFAGNLAFGDDSLYNPNGVVPRENFDSFWEAFLTAFMMMIGDGWNNIMYNGMLSQGNFAGIYHCLFYAFGSIIMINLFLAILLGNFDDSRQFISKQSAFNEFKRLNRKKVPLPIALVIVLGDLGEYISDNVLNDEDLDQSQGNLESQPLREIIIDEKEVKLKRTVTFQDNMNDDSEDNPKMNTEHLKSQETFEKMINTDKDLNPNLVQKDFSLNPQINMNGDIFHSAALQNIQEIPSNQQDGEAYDRELNEIEEQDMHNQHLKLFQNFIEDEDNKEDYFKSEHDDESKSDIEENKQHIPKESSSKFIKSTLKLHKAKEKIEEVNVFTESDDEIINIPVLKKIWNYISKSSLLIFHESWKIRQFLISLQQKCQINQNNENREDNKIKKLEDDEIETESIDSFNEDGETTACIEDIYHLNLIKIINGKIITTKTNITISKWFENFILFIVIVNSITLIFNSPLQDPNSKFGEAMSYLDMVFTIIFTIEATMKIIAMGFFSNGMPGISGYIMDGWNILDFCIVVLSLVDLIFTLSTDGNSTSDDLKSLKALRAFRALRPLRVISRNEGLKLVVNTLFASIPALKNVLLVILLILLIFAIMGVNFFKGTFYYCSLSSSYTQSQTNAILNNVITKSDCISAGGTWINQDENFDNVFESMLSVFQMMTTEGWTTVMYSGMDAKGYEMQPKRNSQAFFCLYYVVFMIVADLFLMNLFVGVIIDNFNKIKEQNDVGGIFVTESQRNWIEIQHTMLSKTLIKKSKIPKNKFKRFFFRIQNHKYFDYTITCSILANTVIMAMRYARMSEEYSNSLDNINYFFAAVFNLEMIIKLFALGTHYFTDSRWNLFDCMIVIGTDVGIVMSVMNIGINISMTATIIRSFRILRMFRLFKSFGRLVIDTFVNILPQITNIMLLVFLLIFIYSVLGISLFADVKYGNAYNGDNNFRNFFQSVVLLFRCITGEAWNDIMNDLTNTDNCNSNQTYADIQSKGIQGCGSWYSYVYFITYMILLRMIIMNLTVAAVINGLQAARKDNSRVIKREDVNVLVNIWAEYDPKATGWIEVTDLVFLLFELPTPMGYGSNFQNFKKKNNEEIKENNADISYILNRFDEEKKKTKEILISGRKIDLFNENPMDIKTQNKQKLIRLQTKFQAGHRSKEDYFVNEERSLFLRKSDAIKILDDFNIPYYANNKVHFKDVCKKVINNTFESNNLKVEVGTRLRKQLKIKWESKYNLRKQKKINIHIQKILAAKILLRWINKYRK